MWSFTGCLPLPLMMMMIPVIYLTHIQVFSFVKLWRLPGLLNCRSNLLLFTCWHISHSPLFPFPFLSSVIIACWTSDLTYPEYLLAYQRVWAKIKGRWSRACGRCGSSGARERVCRGSFSLVQGSVVPFLMGVGCSWRIRGAAPSGWPALRNPHVKKLRSQFLNMRIFFLNRWRKKYFFLETESEFQEMMRKSLFLQETGTRAQMNFFEKNLFSLNKAFFCTCPHTYVYVSSDLNCSSPTSMLSRLRKQYHFK
jgi:hypothetical protein